MEKTRQEIAKEAVLHPRFRENDVNPYWTRRATEYALQYVGDFQYMLDMKKLVEDGTELSVGRAKGVLNCARKEGEELDSIAAMEKQFSNKVEDHFPSVAGGTLVPVEETPVEIDAALGQLYEDTPEESKKLSLDFDFDKFADAVTSSEKAEAEPDKPVSPEQQELSDINKRIREIQTKMQSIKNLHDPLAQIIENSQAEEQELFKVFEQQIQEIRDARKESMAAMKVLELELQGIANDLENQKRLQAITLQNIAAQQLFDETKKQFDELRAGMPWTEQILEYQWDDVCKMAAAFLSGKKGVLNANDMGLGKTAESAFLMDIIIPLFIQKYGRHPLILWLTKKTLRKSTFKEVLRWSPDRQIVVLDGPAGERDFALKYAVANNFMVIANYDMMNTTDILKYDWDIVFMDEVHKLKGGANSKPTLIFENAVKLSKNAKFLVPLSGSPIQNHPAEMWCYLHIFDPDRFPNVKRFKREFCFNWGEVDAQGNPIVSVDWEYIIRAMKDKVIRHSKAEVLTDLPDKTRDPIYVEREGEQEELYQMARQMFFVWLNGNKSARLNFNGILAQLTYLRQINLLPSGIKIKQEDGSVIQMECTQSAKIDECMELIDQLVGAGEQVVVYSSQFNEPLREVQRRVMTEQGAKCRCEMLSGENSGEFETLENEFQEGKIKVLCVNMKTGGEGLNLQKSDQWEGGASHAIFLDLWWNPATNEQAEDRLHRKGQKDAVQIHILQCERSVDQFIAAKLEEKEKMIKGIMEDDALRSGAEWADMLEDLL